MCAVAGGGVAPGAAVDVGGGVGGVDDGGGGGFGVGGAHPDAQPAQFDDAVRAHGGAAHDPGRESRTLQRLFGGVGGGGGVATLGGNPPAGAVMGPLEVVDLAEPVELALELAEVPGEGLAAQPLLEGLLE